MSKRADTSVTGQSEEGGEGKDDVIADDASDGDDADDGDDDVGGV